jgi:hypothetical protein
MIKKISLYKIVIFFAMLLSIAILVVVVRGERKENRNLKQIIDSFVQSSAKGIEKVALLDSLKQEILQMGKEEMLNEKLIIAGITRDNLKQFPTMVKYIELIGKAFKDYRVVIFENDSNDGTKMALEEWKKHNKKVKIISQDFANQKRPSHKFMAEARNQYLGAIQDKEYDDFDILMVIDMDMEQGVDIRGIEDSFSKIGQWDAVCSNGIRSQMGNMMYDMFAFRSEEFPFSPTQWQDICTKNDPNDKWNKKCTGGKAYTIGKDFSHLKDTYLEKDALYWMLIMPQGQRAYPINSSLIPVYSCFGGMAFYKRDFTKECYYDSIEDDCEHVKFHQCLREKNNARMFMNSAQVIRYD